MRGPEEPEELTIVKKLVAKLILLCQVHAQFRNQLVCLCTRGPEEPEELTIVKNL